MAGHWQGTGIADHYRLRTGKWHLQLYWSEDVCRVTSLASSSVRLSLCSPEIFILLQTISIDGPTEGRVGRTEEWHDEVTLMISGSIQSIIQSIIHNLITALERESSVVSHSDASTRLKETRVATNCRVYLGKQICFHREEEESGTSLLPAPSPPVLINSYGHFQRER